MSLHLHSKNSLKFASFCALNFYILTLLSCSKPTPPPIVESFKQLKSNHFLQKKFFITQIQNNTTSTQLLYISHEKSDFSFALLDMLGAPIASKTLNLKEGFKSDKFLPNNALYEELFLNALFLLENDKNTCSMTLKDTTITLSTTQNSINTNLKENVPCPLPTH